MSSDLLSILKSMIVLMQVDKPGIVSGISGISSSKAFFS